MNFVKALFYYFLLLIQIKIPGAKFRNGDSCVNMNLLLFCQSNCWFYNPSLNYFCIRL